MREFTCDSLLEWYALLQQNVHDLGDEHFESFTPTERDEFRADLLEEIRKDYAFKLLTLLEAGIREDFLVSLKRRKRDRVILICFFIVLMLSFLNPPFFLGAAYVD